MVSILAALSLAKAPMGNSGFAADLAMQKPLESVVATGSTISLDLIDMRDNTARACGRDRNGDEREAASRRRDSGALGLSAIALAFGACCVAPWAVTGWECDARGARLPKAPRNRRRT